MESVKGSVAIEDSLIVRTSRTNGDQPEDNFFKATVGDRERWCSDEFGVDEFGVVRDNKVDDPHQSP